MSTHYNPAAAEKKAERIATLKTKLMLRLECAKLRPALNGNLASEFECISVLKKVPMIGEETAFYLVTKGLGDRYYGQSDLIRTVFNNILTAEVEVLVKTRVLGPLKARVLYNALDFARFDHLAERTRDSLGEKLSWAVKLLTTKGADKKEMFDELADLSYFLRTGRHIESAQRD